MMMVSGGGCGFVLLSFMKSEFFESILMIMSSPKKSDIET